MIRDLLGELRKRREEKDEARNLIEEMQRNVDEARNKSYELEQKLNRILWEYIEAFDKERERSRLMMTKKSCKMMQTNRKSSNPGLKPQMESIVFLVAGWVTVKEMKAPQGLCVRTSIMAREQWMTRCGKIYRMTGRYICWKKKKVSCLVISKLNRAEHEHKNSAISR